MPKITLELSLMYSLAWDLEGHAIRAAVSPSDCAAGSQPSLGFSQLLACFTTQHCLPCCEGPPLEWGMLASFLPKSRNAPGEEQSAQVRAC